MSYFEECLDRHYKNYIFTSAIFRHDPKQLKNIYTSALNLVDKKMQEFLENGYPYSKLIHHRNNYKRKITQHYHNQPVYA